MLLPPSEGKTPRRRGRPLDLGSLTFQELTTARQQVISALTEVSGRPDATTELGVSPGLASEVALNLELLTAPATPVEQLYTGVLYDALDQATLDPGARRRARRWILVQSALFGALRLADKVPGYRLSMGVSLPPIGPLAAFWRPVLGTAMPTAVGRGLIVDGRSSTYAAAWTPTGPLAERWVQVRVPGASHMAKHTRGLVAREIVIRGIDPRRPADLAAQLGHRFEVALHEPARPGRPWILDVTGP